MTTYLFVYHAPMTPAEAAPPTPEQMEAVMGECKAWAGKVGDGMIGFGAPLAAACGSPGTASLRAPERWSATPSSRPPISTPPSTWPGTTPT